MKLILVVPVSFLVLLLQPGLIEASTSWAKEPRKMASPVQSSDRLPSQLATLGSSLDRMSSSMLRQPTSVPASFMDKLRNLLHGETAFQRVKKLIFGDPTKCQENCDVEHGYYETADGKGYLPVTEGTLMERSCYCLVQKHLRERIIEEYGKEVEKSFVRKTYMGDIEEAREELANAEPKKFVVYRIVWVTKDDKRVQRYLEATDASIHAAAVAATAMAIGRLQAEEEEAKERAAAQRRSERRANKVTQGQKQNQLGGPEVLRTSSGSFKSKRKAKSGSINREESDIGRRTQSKPRIRIENDIAVPDYSDDDLGRYQNSTAVGRSAAAKKPQQSAPAQPKARSSRKMKDFLSKPENNSDLDRV